MKEKYNKSNLISSGRSFKREDFIFFWGHTDRASGVGHSCLSQWYMSQFVVNDVCYCCAEQYMMAEKARIFGDETVLHQIMTSDSQMVIKKLGRMVKNFDGFIWDKYRCEVVKRGNLAKFSQNDKLMDYLLGTGDKILVEASPKDTIWGIGLAEHEPEACCPSMWRGENLLGFTLMEVRDELRGKSGKS